MFNTPLASDNYSRFMVDVFDERQIIGVPTGFQAFFGRPETGAKTLFSPDSNLVEIDIIRGNEKISAMIKRGGDGRSVAGQKNTSEQDYSTFSRVYPLGEEVGDISANQLNYRVAGENPYAPMGKFGRLRQLALNHHYEHMRRFTRMFEVLAAQSVRTGKMDAILGTSNTDLQYDFRRTAGNTITVTNKWDSGSQTIMADIDGGCDQMREKGHINPDMIIIGGESMDAFISDTDVRAVADNRRFELIEVGLGNPVPEKFMRFVNAGFTPRGRLRTPKGYELWIFTYVDGYTNSSGTFTKYMPESEAVIASSSARCDRYFGPSEMMPQDSARIAWYNELLGFSPMNAPVPMNIKDAGRAIMPEMFYCDAYKGKAEKTISIRTQTAPIFATTMTDAFVTLNGLV